MADKNINSEKPNLTQLKEKIIEKGYTFSVADNPALKYPISVLCGLKIPAVIEAAPVPNAIQVIEDLPAVWDWRTQNGVSPVKDQGYCGSCWAFATVAPFEAAIKIKDKIEIILSEQFLLSCNTDGWGCNGGFWAHQYHVDPGAVLDSCFPYQADDSVPCKDCPHPYKLDSWSYINNSVDIPSVAEMKSAIYQYGPISAAVAVDDYFQAYNGGVFNHNYTGDVNHGITLVGWDDNVRAWILKNSWNTGWGESGYMRIAYGVSQVGTMATYVVYKGNSTK